MGRAREEEDEFLQAVPQDQTMNGYVVDKTKCVDHDWRPRFTAAWEPGFQGTALAPLASAPPQEDWQETVVQRIAVSTLSERKTRTLAHVPGTRRDSGRPKA